MAGPLLRVLGEGGAQHVQEDAAFVGLVLRRGRNRPDGFELDALVHQHGGVAAVVEDHVRAKVRVAVRAGPGEDLLGGPPVFLEGLALPGEHGNALRVLGRTGAHHNGCSGFVLGGEDVAGSPADLGAQSGEGFDQHCGLDRHVEGTGDPCTPERLAGTELFAEGHESGHLVFREADLVAAGLGQGDVGNLVIESHVSPCVVSGEIWNGGSAQARSGNYGEFGADGTRDGPKGPVILPIPQNPARRRAGPTRRR